jgi:hypothetical protein
MDCEAIVAVVEIDIRHFRDPAEAVVEGGAADVQLSRGPGDVAGVVEERFECVDQARVSVSDQSDQPRGETVPQEVGGEVGQEAVDAELVVVDDLADDPRLLGCACRAQCFGVRSVDFGEGGLRSTDTDPAVLAGQAGPYCDTLMQAFSKCLVWAVAARDDEDAVVGAVEVECEVPRGDAAPYLVKAERDAEATSVGSRCCLRWLQGDDEGYCRTGYGVSFLDCLFGCFAAQSRIVGQQVVYEFPLSSASEFTQQMLAVKDRPGVSSGRTQGVGDGVGERSL